jgi:hypothetical protein
MIGLLLAVAAAVVGYIQARRFVSSRLRYVDAAQNRLMPVIAGVGVALLATPLALLPIVSGFTVLCLGAGVGAGASVGAKDVRLARYKLE